MKKDSIAVYEASATFGCKYNGLEQGVENPDNPENVGSEHPTLPRKRKITNTIFLNPDEVIFSMGITTVL